MDSEPAGMFRYEYDSENSEVRLTRYLGDKTQLKIPDEIDENPVIGIDGDCFGNRIIVKGHIRTYT